MDIIQDEQKIAEAVENPIVIETDEQCAEMFNFLLENIKDLTDEEKQLIGTCQSVVQAKVEDCLTFDFVDLLDFTKMYEKYPDHSEKIVACADYLNSVCEFEGDLTPEFYLGVIQAYGCLIPSGE